MLAYLVLFGCVVVFFMRGVVAVLVRLVRCELLVKVRPLLRPLVLQV